MAPRACSMMVASLPTTHCSLLTTHYSLLTTHYSLLTTCLLHHGGERLEERHVVLGVITR